MSGLRTLTLLSRIERKVYEALWSRTSQGRRKWRGVLLVPSLDQTSVAKAVKRLRRKGVLSAAAIARGNSRAGSLFVILRSPDELAIKLGPASVETLMPGPRMP